MTTTTLLELDDIFRRYAWNILRNRVNFIRKFFLDAEDYTCHVDWKSLSIEHKLVKFSPNVKDGTEIETNWGTVQTGDRWVTLMSCDFENKSDNKQSHNFRGSRDTTTWLDVDLTQCFTVEKEVCVDVNVPPNFSKFRAGRDNSFSVNKVRGQVFKEVLNWEVNSQVDVMPGWTAHAELLAREECIALDFEIRTTISNPKGIVPVMFRRKSDKKDMYFVDIKNFQDAFMSVEDGGVITPEEKIIVDVMVEKSVNKDGVETSASFPQLVTKGSCVSMSWSNQKVDIKTSRLSDKECSRQSSLECDGNGNINMVEQNSISEAKLMVNAH